MSRSGRVELERMPVLRCGPPLNVYIARGIENKYVDRPMHQPSAVNLRSGRGTDHFVIGIHYFQDFVVC